jgi:hypothetical protein
MQVEDNYVRLSPTAPDRWAESQNTFHCRDMGRSSPGQPQLQADQSKQLISSNYAPSTRENWTERDTLGALPLALIPHRRGAIWLPARRTVTCVGPTRLRRFDLIRKLRLTRSVGVVQMMTSSPWPVSPKVHEKGVSCVS